MEKKGQLGCWISQQPRPAHLQIPTDATHLKQSRELRKQNLDLRARDFGPKQKTMPSIGAGFPLGTEVGPQGGIAQP